jgi:hypothetical protein
MNSSKEIFIDNEEHTFECLRDLEEMSKFAENAIRMTLRYIY